MKQYQSGMKGCIMYIVVQSMRGVFEREEAMDVHVYMISRIGC